jgi:hypothetical protein
VSNERQELIEKFKITKNLNFNGNENNLRILNEELNDHCQKMKLKNFYYHKSIFIMNL